MTKSWSVLGFLLLAGCVQTQATMLGPSTARSPVPEDQVQIFLSEEDVPEHCDEIALINAQGSANMTNESQMLRAGRKRAGQIGANAIAMQSVNEPSSGAKVAAAIFGVGAERRGQMVALYCSELPTETGVSLK
jgi:hypothetical protein